MEILKTILVWTALVGWAVVAGALITAIIMIGRR
jgi:hypothetical protein